jgi:hypothetical protein
LTAQSHGEASHVADSLLQVGFGSGRALQKAPRQWADFLDRFSGPLRGRRLLFGRSWRQVTRDKVTNVARAMTNVSSAIIFGSIFWRLGRGQTSIQDRMGLLQVHLSICARFASPWGAFADVDLHADRQAGRQAYRRMDRWTERS